MIKHIFLILLFISVNGYAGGFFKSHPNVVVDSGNITVDGAVSVSGGTVNVAMPTHQDSISSAIKVIDYGHAEMHSGSSYFYSELITLNGSASRGILITTPNSATKKIHLTGTVNCIFECNIKFYEDTTTFSDGSGVTELNRNRSSSNTADGVLTVQPDINSVGTLMVEMQIGNASSIGGAAKFGGSTDQRDEWVLDGSQSKYLLLITSAAAANDTSIMLNWYEHTDQ